jgi:hypothetical protein
MANKWETLDPDTKRMLARQMMSGKDANPDNLNRAMEILARDPRKVEEMLQDAGVDNNDMELDDTAPDQDEREGGISDDIEQMLAQHSSADMQETGRVASEIPPPEPGESMQAYTQRLMALSSQGSGRARQKAMGGQNTGNVVEEDE